MLASFKSKIGNVFCPAIFLHFRMVWYRFSENRWCGQKKAAHSVSNIPSKILLIFWIEFCVQLTSANTYSSTLWFFLCHFVHYGRNGQFLSRLVFPSKVIPSEGRFKKGFATHSIQHELDLHMKVIRIIIFQTLSVCTPGSSLLLISLVRFSLMHIFKK